MLRSRHGASYGIVDRIYIFFLHVTVLSVVFVFDLWSFNSHLYIVLIICSCNSPCRYASETNIVRYAKIAVLLHNKTVRDVALRCRWMNVSSQKFMSYFSQQFCLSIN